MVLVMLVRASALERSEFKVTYPGVTILLALMAPFWNAIFWRCFAPSGVSRNFEFQDLMERVHVEKNWEREPGRAKRRKNECQEVSWLG